MVQRVPVASRQHRGQPGGEVARRLGLAGAVRSPAGRSAPDGRSGRDGRAGSGRAARPPGRRRRETRRDAAPAAGLAPAQCRGRPPPLATARAPPPPARAGPPPAAAARRSGCDGCSVSRRTRSPGGGSSATWHSRISTISAAARRSGAVSTSPMPFSSICQARPSVAMDSRSANAAPRVRSASGNSADCRAAPAPTSSRVSVCTRSSKSCSSTPRSAPRACARSVIASASAGGRPSAPRTGRTPLARSARPSMSATASAVMALPGSVWAIAWSSSDSPSRAEPSAARAISVSASGATARLPARRCGRNARSARPPKCGADRSAGSATARSPEPCGFRWWRR